MKINPTLLYSSKVDVPINVPEPIISSKNLAQFKKGTGGRSSFSGHVVTVFGATGFMGSFLINRLAKIGCQIIIPYRCDWYFVRELKIVGDLGQILFFPFQLKDEQSIRKSVKYSNVVINMIGSRISTKNYSMYETHVESAKRIARISREMGVDKLIHISALNSDPNYKPLYYKKAEFLKTKGLGELAVRDEFPDATIVRPSVIFGERDAFTRCYINFHRKGPLLSNIFLYKKGLQTYKMPVYAGDVAAGITRIVSDPTAKGKTFEFPGPNCYQLSEIVDYMYKKAKCTEETMNPVRIVSFEPYFLCALFYSEFVMEKIFKMFYNCNREWVEYVEACNDVLSHDALTFADLGIQRLTEFEYVGGKLCFLRCFVHYYDFCYKETEEPPLPLRAPPMYKQRAKDFSTIEIVTKEKPFSFLFSR